jgi:hypothetical protein
MNQLNLFFYNLEFITKGNKKMVLVEDVTDNSNNTRQSSSSNQNSGSTSEMMVKNK